MKTTIIQQWVGTLLISFFCCSIGLIVLSILLETYWLLYAATVLFILQILIYYHKGNYFSTYTLQKFTDYLKNLFSENTDHILKHPHLLKRIRGKRRALIIKRSENKPTAIVKDSLTNESNAGYECIWSGNGRVPAIQVPRDLKVTIGNAQCKLPYSLSLLNIDLLHHVNCDVRRNSLLAGAQLGGFAVNTGKRGICSDSVRHSSDLIWQIAPFDHSFSNNDGSFNSENFSILSKRPYVKMIEVKLTKYQQAVLDERTSASLINFLQKIRTLSGYKPIGIRIDHAKDDFLRSFAETQCFYHFYVDFITIEDPALTQVNLVEPAYKDLMPFFDVLANTRNVVNAYHLPCKIIASQMISTEFDLLRTIALGADACFTMHPLLLIGAKKKWLSGIQKNPNGIANFHKNTLAATSKLMELCRYKNLQEVQPEDFYRRETKSKIKNLKQIYFEDPLHDLPVLY